MKRKGIYFSITGGDGTGKTSVQNGLKPLLKKLNIETFSEPGGTYIANLIRRAILTNCDSERTLALREVFRAKGISETTKHLAKKAHKHLKEGRVDLFEVFAFAAARSESNDRVKKTIERGKNILGVRSFSCSVAYQGYGRGLGLPVIEEAHKEIELIKPTFEIFLDLPLEVAEERLSFRSEKSDRLDEEGRSFHERTIRGYKEYYSGNPFPVFFVDASKTLDEVIREIEIIIRKEFKKTPII